ncbi:MAG: hypothetical protein A2762_00165 [Candidatus Lloydbacteria bacterium RIFCSPHIGHO2_01_FULL_54_11]|nr:MAG: hypothetical protein A2762_00165 [Candidatus Lloydbacteria bacterium RIFCSPHIGHO2_01_FULL_54_11]
MRLYPNDTLDFHDMFPPEEACAEHLIRLRWPDGFVCPHGQATRAWKKSTVLFRCASCRRDTSASSGAIFRQSHLPLRLGFQIMWEAMSQKHGASALGLSHALGLSSHKTIAEALQKLRRAMIRPGRERLAGLIEADEIIVGGVRPGSPGRSRNSKVLAPVAVEDRGKNGIGRIRLSTIADASANTLEYTLRGMIEPRCSVRTDGWRGYQRLRSLGYGHRVMERKDTEPGVDTAPLAHRISALLKRWLPSTHQGSVRPAHLQPYLNEFAFRFNRRHSHSRGLLFHRLLSIAVIIEPQPMRPGMSKHLR